MGEPQKYTAEDLLLDDKFLEWIHSDGQRHNDYWQDRLLSDSPLRLAFDQAREIALMLSARNATADATAALQQLQAKIKKPVKNQGQQPWRKIWKAAAAIALLCSLSWFFWPQNQSFQTNFAEIKTIHLPDGTVVTLRANSKLWWEGNWDENQKRIVFLEGEAYFDVRSAKEKDINRPFIVRAKPLEVEVLGTKFNLVNRPTRTQVVLVEGEVAVKSKDQKLYELAPQQKYTWNNNLQQANIQTVDVSFYTDWQQYIWRFDNTSLSDVSVMIEDHFGQTIVFGSTGLKDRKLNGSAPSSSLETLLKGIEISLNISISYENDRIVFREKTYEE